MCDKFMNESPGEVLTEHPIDLISKNWDEDYMDLVDRVKQFSAYVTRRYETVPGTATYDNGAKSIFFTSLYGTDELFHIFLNGIPEEIRQYYNCSTCRKFFRRFGNLAIVAYDGTMESILWPDNLPESHLFYEIVQYLRCKITNSYAIRPYEKMGVFGVEHSIGFPDFRHFVGQVMSCKHSNDIINKDVIDNFMSNIVYDKKIHKKAKFLLEDNRIHLRLKYYHIAKIYENMLDRFEKASDHEPHCKSNIAADVLHQTNILHANSSMYGFLINMISAGTEDEEMIENFNELTAPEVYAKPVAAATHNQLKETNKIISELGLESALKRRIALTSEVKALWRKVDSETPKSKDSDLGIFAALDPKRKEKNTPTYIKKRPITCAKLIDLLPNITDIEIKPLHTIGGITCPVDENAGNLIGHPGEPESNQFSTYFYTQFKPARYWNLTDYSDYYTVNTICFKPTHWRDDHIDTSFDKDYDSDFAIMFLIDNCYDTGDVPGVIFEQTIRKDIRSRVGRSVYQLTLTMPLEGLNDPNTSKAYGVSYSGNCTTHMPIRFRTKNNEYFETEIISYN